MWTPCMLISANIELLTFQGASDLRDDAHELYLIDAGFKFLYEAVVKVDQLATLRDLGVPDVLQKDLRELVPESRSLDGAIASVYFSC